MSLLHVRAALQSRAAGLLTTCPSVRTRAALLRGAPAFAQLLLAPYACTWWPKALCTAIWCPYAPRACSGSRRGYPLTVAILSLTPKPAQQLHSQEPYIL